MFYLASREFNIRLDKSLFIGDDIRDCLAAYNAGLKSAYLGTHHDLEELSENQKPIYHSDKLSNIIPNIFNFSLKNVSMIITRTPFRISFAGGGTDLKEYYSNEPWKKSDQFINK